MMPRVPLGSAKRRNFPKESLNNNNNMRRKRAAADITPTTAVNVNTAVNDPTTTTAPTVERMREIYGQRWLSNIKLRELELETGIPYKRGKFTDKDKALVDRFVQEYTRQNNLTTDQFNEQFFGDPSRRSRALRTKFFSQLAMTLDGRPVVTVYHHVKRSLNPGNYRGRWEAEDDEELRRLYAMHGPSWALIGRSLDRSLQACRDRYRLIQQRPQKGRWTDAETARLKAAINQVIDRSDHQRSDTWIQIAELVGTRSASQCLTKWYECTQFAESPQGVHQRLRWSQMDDFKLVQAIYDSGAEDESEIRWREDILRAFGSDHSRHNLTSKRLRERWQVLRKRLVRRHGQTLSDILEDLMDYLRPLSPNSVIEDDTIAL